MLDRTISEEHSPVIGQSWDFSQEKRIATWAILLHVYRSVRTQNVEQAKGRQALPLAHREPLASGCPG
jgi:hypothetical protein